jgi:hypothetical protein
MSLTTAYRSCATEQHVIRSRNPTNPANDPKPIFEWTRAGSSILSLTSPLARNAKSNKTKLEESGTQLMWEKTRTSAKGNTKRVSKRGAHLRKNLGFPKATQGELAKGANKTEASWQQEGPTK